MAKAIKNYFSLLLSIDCLYLFERIFSIKNGKIKL